MYESHATLSSGSDPLLLAMWKCPNSQQGQVELFFFLKKKKLIIFVWWKVSKGSPINRGLEINFLPFCQAKVEHFHFGSSLSSVVIIYYHKSVSTFKASNRSYYHSTLRTFQRLPIPTPPSPFSQPFLFLSHSVTWSKVKFPSLPTLSFLRVVMEIEGSRSEGTFRW